MRILVVSAVFPPHVFGGGEISAFDMAHLLHRKGHKVSVLTMAEKDEPESWGQSEEAIPIYRLRFPRKVTNYQAHFANMTWLQWKFWHLQDFADYRMLAKLDRVLDEAMPDHLNIHILDGLGFNLLPLVRRRGLTVSYFLHELALVCSNGGMYRDGKKCERQCGKCKIVSALKGHYLRNLKDHVVYVSPSRANLETVRKYVSPVQREPGFVLKNVPDQIPDPMPEHQWDPKRGLNLLYVGRIHETKGVQFLLSTLAELSKTFTFHLLLLGRGPDEEKLTKEYAGCTWVSFGGFVGRAEVSRAIGSHDLLCVPSLWAEIYGRVTAEALKLCTPVFGSSIGGTVELVRDGQTGRLLPPGNEDAWKAALTTVFENPEILRDYRKNAAEFAAEFDEERIADQFEKILTNLTSARSR